MDKSKFYWKKCLEKEDIAKKLNISSLSISFIKKKDERSVYPDSKKKKKCGRKKMTTPKMNKRIINMAVKNRRLPCWNIPNILQAKKVNIAFRTAKNKYLNGRLKAHCARKKTLLTQTWCNSVLSEPRNIKWTLADLKQIKTYILF